MFDSIGFRAEGLVNVIYKPSLYSFVRLAVLDIVLVLSRSCSFKIIVSDDHIDNIIVCSCSYSSCFLNLANTWIPHSY